MNTHEQSLPQIEAQLRRVERRDWWLWGTAVCITLLLTGAVVSLSLPGLVGDGDYNFEQDLHIAVRGLIGMVLLFNLYALYQKLTIKRLRNQLAKQHCLTSQMEARAREFHQLALRDPLTDLYNRRFADRHLETELARASRSHSPLSVLLFDLCNFKQINDHFGHAAGDLALRQFAANLRDGFRLTDILIRMGGDEFMVVLPECRAEEIPLLVERMAPTTIRFQGERIEIACSAGWAEARSGETTDQLLERADQMMYAHKRARNQKQRAAEAPARSRQKSSERSDNPWVESELLRLRANAS